jgi:putative acetyltransferase
MEPNVRLETAANPDAITEVNRIAFGGDAEPRLVRALREGGYVRLSMVAEVGGEVVGHVG